MLRRLFAFLLLLLSFQAFAADGATQLKVDPALLPPSKRVKKPPVAAAGKDVENTPAAQAGTGEASEAATTAPVVQARGADAAPAATVAPAVEVTAPVPVVVQPNTGQAPAARAPAQPATEVSIARGMAPLKIDPALLPKSKRTPPSQLAGKRAEPQAVGKAAPAASRPTATAAAGLPAASAVAADAAMPEAVEDEIEDRGVEIARGLPPLKVDPALLRDGKRAGRGYAARRGGRGRTGGAYAAQDEDEVDGVEPELRGPGIARGLPALKVDPALLTQRDSRKALAASRVGKGRRAGRAAVAGGRGTAPFAPIADTALLALTEDMQRQAGDAAVYMEGDRLSGSTDELITVQGTARLRKPNTQLFADTITYAPPTDELTATGNVVLTRGSDVIEGPAMHMKLERNEGVFENPRYKLKRNLQTGGPMSVATTGHGVADRMDFLGEDRVSLKNATYSTCEPGRTDWYAEAEQLDLNFNSEIAEASKGRIVFKGVPVLYAPSLEFSLNNRRKSGFLAPTFGTTNKTGLDFLLPYYWNIAPNMDATIATRLLSTRGLMLSNEFRYLQEGYEGIVKADILPNDIEANRNRFAFSFKHTHDLAPNLTASVNINTVSDKNYYSDLGSRLAITSVSYLPRELNLNYAGPWWDMNAKTLQYQEMVNRVPIYEQMPTLSFNAYRADLPFGGVFSLNSSFSDFRIDDNSRRRDQGRRLVMYPQLSRPFTSDAFWITPKLGLHMTRYNLSSRERANQDDSLTRNIPIFSMDAGVAFERDTDIFGEGLIQTLEPRLFYVNSQRRDQNQFPVFDTAQADFTLAQIFSENTFTGSDRIADSNQLTAAAVSRLVDPATGAERVRLVLGQRFYFKDSLVTLPGGTPRTDRVADVLAGVSGEVLPKLKVDAAFQYNPRESQTERYSLGTRWSPLPAQTVNAAYRYRRDVLQDVDVSTQWPITNRWYAVGRYNYSVRDQRLVEGLGGLEYNGGCWVVRVVGSRFITRSQTAKTALFFQLELNDFSSIGSNPLDMLKRSIPGYGAINQATADPIFGEGF